jgi:hypothetical protein
MHVNVTKSLKKLSIILMEEHKLSVFAKSCGLQIAYHFSKASAICSTF